MKKYCAQRAVILLALFLAMGLLAGCETCKGFNRDIKRADTWIQDNLW